MFPQNRTNPRELRAQNAEIVRKMEAMISAAEAEHRDFTPSEQTTWDDYNDQSATIMAEVHRKEMIPTDLLNSKGPNYLRYGRGDSESRAMAAYIRRGDLGALAGQTEEGEDGFQAVVNIPRGQMRATDQILDLTDGAPVVPTGLAGVIAARMSEMRLSDRLGCRQVPGQGTTVNFPYENADPAAFGATSEQVDNHANVYQRDRPTLGTKAFTLAKKTKVIELTEELMQDEDASLIAFIGDHIGRAMATTHNTMLLTEVAANGTVLKTFASATAIAAGEPEDLVYHNTLSYYLDDSRSCGWVMKPSTLGAIKKLTGDSRLYTDQIIGGGRQLLLEYPTFFSAQAGSIAASGKSLYFGNWFFVGLREAPAINLLRDPYSVQGLVLLRYMFRAVYGVLIQGAIGYGVHPTG